MAVLSSKDNMTELLVRPYRIREEGQPTWILTEIILAHKKTQLVRTTITLTGDDLSGLIELARSFAEPGTEPSLELASTDDDFCLEIRAGRIQADRVVSCFIGDLYDLRRGFQFVTDTSRLLEFSARLKKDALDLPSVGALP